MRSNTRCDDARARDELGIQPRPLAQTYRDTIRWLHHTGQLTARQAGDTTSADRGTASVLHA